MIKKLDEVCRFYSGTGFPVAYQGKSDGELPFYKVGDIANNVAIGNVYLSLCNNYISRQEASEIRGSIIPKGTIVFAKIGEALKLNRRAITNCDCLIDNNAMGIAPMKELLRTEYFFYFMKQLKMQEHAETTTVPSVRRSKLEQVEIDVPSLDKQEEIEQILNKTSMLIHLRQQELQRLDDLVKARFIELFGDPKINPNNYPVCQLSDFIVFLTSGSRGWAQYCADDGTEWFITIKNVKGCHIETDNMQPINAPNNAEAKRTRVQEGDLLISITADLGRTGVVTKEIAEHGAYINQHLTCIRLKQDVLNPLYVAYFMESPAGKEQFESKNQSAVKAGLNFNSINSLRLMIPPLDDQNAFIDFIKQTDKSKAAIQKALDEAQLLFDSLMQKYFG